MVVDAPVLRAAEAAVLRAVLRAVVRASLAVVRADAAVLRAEVAVLRAEVLGLRVAVDLRVVLAGLRPLVRAGLRPLGLLLVVAIVSCVAPIGLRVLLLSADSGLDYDRTCVCKPDPLLGYI